jgi:hypothetical protein
MIFGGNSEKQPFARCGNRSEPIATQGKPMKLHPRNGCGFTPSSVARTMAVFAVALTPCVSQALVSVRAGVADHPFQVSTNFNNRANPLVEYQYTGETPVPNALPPLFGLVSGYAQANGSAGTLRARSSISNPGPGSGVIPGATLNMAASIEETIELYYTSGGGSRNVGTAGLGDPNDDFVTVRASGVLRGSGSVGSATGVPPGVSPSGAGSARGVFSLHLGIANFSLATAGFTVTESTSLSSIGSDITERDFDYNLGNGYVSGDSVILNISKTYLSNNPNAMISFSAGLRAEARGGFYSGSQVSADYGNTAYIDFDIEQGMFWAPTGTSSTRNFLTNQVFAPPVPEPGTAAMLLMGLAVLGGGVYKRNRSAS